MKAGIVEVLWLQNAFSATPGRVKDGMYRVAIQIQHRFLKGKYQPF